MDFDMSNHGQNYGKKKWKPQSFVFQVLFLGSLDTEFQCFKEKVSFYKHKSCYFKVLFK